MASVGQKDTGPEKTVRSYLHKMGIHYRLHVKQLPGKPDLVFPGRRGVLFVHGCFWHGHDDKECKLARIPKSNVAFWKSKIQGNQARDQRNYQVLKDAGWRVLTVWECQLRDENSLEELFKTISQM